MVYSHWLCPRPRHGPMGCMVLCRTLHIAPEQGQGRMDYVPIFQVLKLFQVVYFNCISVAFRCPVLVPDTTTVNGFCIISVSVPLPDTVSVNKPSVGHSVQ